MTYLKSGAKQCPGGKRRGAGRPPNWYKEFCEGIIIDKKLLPRLGDIAEGKEIFKKVDLVGNQHDVAADPAVQVIATDKLMDRAWGKTPQPSEITGDLNLTISVTKYAEPTNPNDPAKLPTP